MFGKGRAMDKCKGMIQISGYWIRASHVSAIGPTREQGGDYFFSAFIGGEEMVFAFPTRDECELERVRLIDLGSEGQGKSCGSAAP